MAGFGRSPFGRGPFGRSDAGSDLIVELFPDEYFDPKKAKKNGSPPHQNEDDPLVQVLKTYGKLVQNRRLEIERIPTLLDYEKMPLEIVREWGNMLGLGIDKNDPEFLQRSFLGNASQWLQLKAAKRGYEVRGLASGFTVEVENFWRIDPMWAPYIPPRFLFLIKPQKNYDPTAVPILHTDSPPGTHPGTPLTETYTYAKSSYLRVTFEVADPRRSGVDYNLLLDLVIDKIKDVVGIHHELYKVVFQMRMPVDASNITVDMLIEEHSNWNANVQNIYDIDAADVHPTDDGHLTVEFVAFGDGSVLDVDAAPEIVIYIDDTYVVPLEIDVNENTTWMIEEDSIWNLYENNLFDVDLGDEHPLDYPGITVTMDIQIVEPNEMTMPVNAYPYVDMATSISEEQSIMEVDSTDADLFEINEASVIAVAATPTVNLFATDTNIPINVAPTAAISQIQSFISAEVTETVSSEMASSNELISMSGDLSLAAQILIPSDEILMSVDVGEYAQILIPETESIDASLSITSNFTSYETSDLEITPVIAVQMTGHVEFLNAAVTPNVAIVPEIQSNSSVDTNLTVSSTVSSTEVSSVDVNNSVTIAVEVPAETMVMNTDVSITPVISAFEQTGILIDHSSFMNASSSVQFVYYVATNISVEIQIPSENSTDISVDANTSASISAFEHTGIAVDESVTTGFSIAEHESLEVSAAQTISMVIPTAIIPVEVNAVVALIVDATEHWGTAIDATISSSISSYEVSAVDITESITTSITIPLESEIINVNASISSDLSISEQLTSSASQSTSVEQQVAEQAQATSSLSLSASIDIPVEAVSIGITVGTSSDLQVAEHLTAEASESASVSWSAFEHEVIGVSVGSSASIQVPTEDVSFGISVSPTTSVAIAEHSSIEAVESASVSWSAFEHEVIGISVGGDASMLIPTAIVPVSVNANVTVGGSGFAESGTTDINASLVVPMTVSESTPMSASSSISIGIDIVSAIVPISVSEGVTFGPNFFESTTINQNVGETASFQNLEQMSAYLSLVGSSQMVAINAVTYINVAVNTSVTGTAESTETPQDVIIPVGVSGTVSFVSGYENSSQQVALSQSVGLLIGESSQSLNEKGWIIDPLYNYDLREADTFVADGTGTVTMTITEGP